MCQVRRNSCKGSPWTKGTNQGFRIRDNYVLSKRSFLTRPVLNKNPDT